MNTDFRHWSKTLEPIMVMNNTMMQCAQELGRRNLELITDYIGMGLKQCQTPLTQKNPKEWVETQVDVTCKAIEKTIEAFQKSSKTMMEAMTECRGKCEDIMKHKCHTTTEADTDAGMGVRSHHRKS